MRKEGYLILSKKACWQTILYFCRQLPVYFSQAFICPFLGVSTIWAVPDGLIGTRRILIRIIFYQSRCFSDFRIFLAHAVNGFRISWSYF